MSKSKEDVRISIKKFILENYLFGFNENELEDDSSFLKLGILDSTGIMELVAFIEKNYCIDVSDNEITPENLDSIECISKFVLQKTI